ncbi:hypothetical protein GLOIN_2v1513485 [Rhizophagus irregularis DAOM 181602=DAOM 197198]|nr:hypothetical protein GLOIN_2v1513485 [Rhizophagus irregularis DAOM 181602=DAOM 197198]
MPINAVFIKNLKLTKILTQQCILAIGDTGNEKSFTANIFDANAKVEDTSKSETDEIIIHNIKGDFYIDMPRFNDTNEEKKDEKTVCAFDFS